MGYFEKKYGNGYGDRSTDNFNSSGRRTQYNNYGPTDKSKGSHAHDHYFYNSTTGRSGWAGSGWERKKK